MADTTSEMDEERIQRLLVEFFHQERCTSDDLQEAVRVRDLFYNPVDVLPFLQSALLDNKVLEVEIDGLTRVYFTRLYDDLPPLEEMVEEEDEVIAAEAEYAPAEYLKEMTYFLSLPLEPAKGNIAVRNAQKVIFRLFTASYTVELGTSFDRLADVRGERVLRFNFPVIGRVVRGFREFRAKVPKEMSLRANIKGLKNNEIIGAVVADISAKDIGIKITNEQQQLVKEDEIRPIEILFEGKVLVEVNVKVRHIKKIRGKAGSDYVCDLQFDLATGALARKVEVVVAQVQRAHLKKFSELSEESGLDLIA
jgi:hypothetical protein